MNPRPLGPEQKAEQQRILNLTQELRAEYAKKSDGTFASDEKFLNRYEYRLESLRISTQIMREHLDKRLAEQAYLLDGSEIAHFLAVCAVLMRFEVINFQTVQSYILKLKEDISNASDSN